jgi:hypothetical protein
MNFSEFTEWKSFFSECVCINFLPSLFLLSSILLFCFSQLNVALNFPYLQAEFSRLRSPESGTFSLPEIKFVPEAIRSIVEDWKSFIPRNCFSASSHRELDSRTEQTFGLPLTSIRCFITLLAAHREPNSNSSAAFFTAVDIGTQFAAYSRCHTHMARSEMMINIKRGNEKAIPGRSTRLITQPSERNVRTGKFETFES